MRLVIQRVSSASVSSGGNVVGSINKGLFILVGVGQDDSVEKANLLSEKLLKMRIMSDENDKMNLSIIDVQGEVLVVSQFTLYADTSGGNRPSFVKAANPQLAKEVYEKFVESLRAQGLKVETGSFGNYMNIKTELDGPVTILI
ncbi:MAG: D-aminoacyl-tRNA deacylase [Patescibacteria group bacterium]